MSAKRTAAKKKVSERKRNLQPFYHRVEVLFTATEDLSVEVNDRNFKDDLAKFLRNRLGTVIRASVDYDAECTAEPGDPLDLM